MDFKRVNYGKRILIVFKILNILAVYKFLTFKKMAQITRNDKQKRAFKIIVVGDSYVGKTCLAYRFCEGKFSDKFEPTIGVDFRARTVELNGEEIEVSRQHCKSKAKK
jgi:GTPase SAR1 family protein